MSTPYRAPAPPPPEAPEPPPPLGEVRSRHRVRGTRLWIFVLVLIAICVVVAALIAGAGGVASVKGLLKSVVLGLVVIVGFHYGKLREVLVHETGYRGRRWLLPDVVVHFDAVRDLFRRFDTAGVLSAKVITGSTLVLVGTDDERLHIPHDVTDGEALGRHLDRHVVRPVRLEALKAFDEGEELRFGPLTVSRVGATWTSRRKERGIPWEDVQHVKITAEELTLKHGKRIARGTLVVPLRQLPFPLVLMSVLHEAPVEVRFSGGFRAPG